MDASKQRYVLLKLREFPIIFDGIRLVTLKLDLLFNVAMLKYKRYCEHFYKSVPDFLNYLPMLVVKRYLKLLRRYFIYVNLPIAIIKFYLYVGNRSGHVYSSIILFWKRLTVSSDVARVLHVFGEFRGRIR